MTQNFGVDVIEFTNEQALRMQEAGAPVVIDMVRKEFGDAIVDKWLAICKQAEENKDAIVAGTYTGVFTD
ncbi:MAG: hypothetical protein FWH25_03675 [Syntrophorhabdaceae bacterium]|nr:hypothetical protein [Syntrophorhabdaceae bacterium]